MYIIHKNVIVSLQCHIMMINYSNCNYLASQVKIMGLDLMSYP